MVYSQKTVIQKGIDVEISTISLTLQKGFGVRSSGIPLALIKDQFDRARILLDRMSLRLKGVRYVFQASISGNSTSYKSSEMAVFALLIVALKGQEHVGKYKDVFVGSFDLNGSAINLEYPEKFYVAALKAKATHLILPEANIQQLPKSKGMILVGIRTLKDLLQFIETRRIRPFGAKKVKASSDSELIPYFSQPMATRALELAIVGRHH